MSRPATRWRLELDGAACDAHGICMLRSPSLINLDEWGYATLSGEQITDDATLRQVKRAVAACPEHALRLVGDTAPQVRPVTAVRRGA